MHPDGHVARRGLAAEEAVADVEGPGIVSIAVSEHDDAILADEVSAGKPGWLRSPAQAAQTGAAALDATPPAPEAREVVSVSVRCCHPANELLEVADKVVQDPISDATPWEDITLLLRGSDAGLTYLSERWPVQLVEDVLAIEHCSGVSKQAL